jgi:E3 ubiquitin-protein ligase HERC3
MLLNTSTATITHIEPVQISSGSNHSCVRYNDGSVKCFGLGSSGQLGNGATTNLGDTAGTLGGNIPFVNLGTGRTATSIATGYVHSCALLDNAMIKCWGQNTYGQLGVGSTVSMGSGANQMGDSLPAVNLGVGRTAVKLFAMGYHTCAILDNAVAKCWGRNGSGQLGLGDIVNRGTSASQMGDTLAAVNVGAGRTASKLVGGLDFTCALLDNSTVKCWGNSRYGQVGQENSNSIGDGAGQMAALASINLGTGRTAVDIGGGYSHACAILDNSTSKCWGRNNKGQVGVNSASNTFGATAGSMGDALIANPFTSFVPAKIAGGNTFTCAMNAAGAVRCWGLGTTGQLLVGSSVNIGRSNNDIEGLTNVNMGTSVAASSVSVQFNSVCAIMTNKRIKCWGSSLSGATGSGQTANNLGDVAGELGDSLPYVNH